MRCLFQLLENILYGKMWQMGLEQRLDPEPAKETTVADTVSRYINDRHRYLTEERTKLRGAEASPADNIDLIFEQFEATPLSFDVYVGDDYRTVDANSLGSRILIEILRKYLNCELPHFDDDQKEYEIERFKGDMRKGYQLTFDASGWRVSFNKLYEKTSNGEYKFDNVAGFTANVYHNGGGYFKANNPMIAEDQLRYRILINDIEIMLIEKGIKYGLRETKTGKVISTSEER